MTVYMHSGADVDRECGQRNYYEESGRPGCKLLILINTGGLRACETRGTAIPDTTKGASAANATRNPDLCSRES
ncbi:hypothetical protein P7K49_035708 [Saguinus oedipus]|uniref:Uncharacterized protein n=1 Tax=Saguinus oedipus TaxID=9490 RepID=A0ABQ9TNF1_SAGOE|nr:hypothetical protein P7K49_035708 [Saguinus oedipus]